MFVRMTEVRVKEGRWDAAVALFRAEIFPLLEKEPGFMRVLLVGDGGAHKGVLMTLWQTQQHGTRYEQSGEAEKLMQPFREMLAAPPETVAYPVLFDREF